MMDIDGAIDLHVHTAPDVYDRSVDDLQLLRDAESVGMRGVLLKSHHTLTADRAILARSHTELEVFGGITLNHSVGGINPVAVETAIAFGARQVWMPTLHAAHCLEHAEPEMFRAEARQGRVGLRIVDDQGALRPEVRTVLELIRDADIALGTGHLSPVESLTLIETAAGMGITKILVTHPLMAFTRFDQDQMRAAVSHGALLEFDYLSCSPNWHGAVPPARTAAAISAIGAEHCVLASDGGQTFNPTPPMMMRQFAEALRVEGLEDLAIRRMMRENPARILGLH